MNLKTTSKHFKNSIKDQIPIRLTGYIDINKPTKILNICKTNM